MLVSVDGRLARRAVERSSVVLPHLRWCVGVGLRQRALHVLGANKQGVPVDGAGGEVGSGNADCGGSRRVCCAWRRRICRQCCTGRIISRERTRLIGRERPDSP